MLKRHLALIAVAVTVAVAAPHAQSKPGPKVTGPSEQFGHNIGDDYFLVNYSQYETYLKKMDVQSERMMV
ncbi:MAG TPA: hypothetical protein VKH42_15470, partial [Vicinamibacterales bacterium]|nr:hypothetical protein [Vicinamibacterales bacterium]